MSSSGKLLKGSVPTLKQFMHRQRVQRLYRTLLKTARKIPDDHYRRDFTEQTRESFRKHLHEKNEDIVRIHLLQAEQQLRELQQAMALAQF